MSLNKSHSLRGRLGRVAATIGTVAIAATLAFGTAAPAQAAQNIDPDAVGSITVHKFAEPTSPTEAVNNGTEVDTTGLTAIEGVTFTVQQVNLDLTDSATWQGLEDYTVAQAQGNLAGVSKTETTVAGGIAAFTGLPVGLYLVTETNTGSNNIALHGAPFLVTIPLALNNDWNYDVHVYPKNTVTGLTKAINDSAAHVIGDPVNFTLKAQVPSLPVATPLTAFGITDALDARLSYVGATVIVDGLPLSTPADYTLGATGQNFTLTFNEAGLTKLRTVQGKDVTVTLNTTVNSLGDGAITNTAKVFVNDPAKTFDSNTVTTSWGALKVSKYAAEDAAKFLSGAEFELYALDAEGVRSTGALQDVTDADTIFTTGTDGTFTVNGLKAGKYELVETKAPLGYKLDSTPITVEVTVGDISKAVVLPVSNTQVPAFQLPLTGSTGISLFIGGGLVLVVGGIVLAMVRKRRTHQA